MVDPLPKDELKEGDLVFFKIKSRSITHIGIYLGDNRFAHASSSRGVVISNLNEPYYSRYFYKGGRILDGVKEDLIQE
ncbi:Murein DD-endopeptidase MepS/Murein LD-carboxypeptidase precursor [compost metagenome]